MSVKKILITGASGMLGQALSERLRPAYELTGISQTGRLQTIPCDLTEDGAASKVLEAVTPDLVIHCAAASNVDACEKDPGTAYRVNALATRFLAQACAPAAIPLVHISTDYVFNGQKPTPYVEEDPTFPINVYGMTKLAAEAFVRCALTDAVIVRTSWLFGRGNPSNFVSVILKRLLAREDLTVLEDQLNAPTSTVDLAAALERIAADALARRACKAKAEIRTYHLCNRGVATRYEMALEMKRILGLESVKISRADAAQIQNRSAVRPARSVMSSARFESDFAVSMRPWPDALADFLKTETK